MENDINELKTYWNGLAKTAGIDWNMAWNYQQRIEVQMKEIRASYPVWKSHPQPEEFIKLMDRAMIRLRKTLNSRGS